MSAMDWFKNKKNKNNQNVNKRKAAEAEEQQFKKPKAMFGGGHKNQQRDYGRNQLPIFTARNRYLKS